MASAAAMAAFKARIEGASLAYPVRYPNDAFALPADPARFVAVQYPLAQDRQASFGAPGSNVFRESGVLRLVIHEPVTVGVDAAAAFAETLRVLFRNARFAGVRCYAPSSPVFDDRQVEGNYCRLSIAVPYDFDVLA